MNTRETPYGTLTGLESRPLASNAKTDACALSERITLTTPFGELVPQYATEDMGRRTLKPISFYKDGSLKSVPLQSSTLLKTSVGTLPAELVTFHPNGAIRRLFPLDGKLSGFWSWQNEYALAEELEFETPQGMLKARIIALQFYPSGALKSITLWPANVVTLTTPQGLFKARKGVAFHESGALRSFEPLQKIVLQTPIGAITAYDSEPNGIHGDSNSVQFDEEGALTALSTIDHAVKVESAAGTSIFKPGVKNNVCGDERKVAVPMQLAFADGRITFHGDPALSFTLDEVQCRVLELHEKHGDPAYSCS